MLPPELQTPEFNALVQLVRSTANKHGTIVLILAPDSSMGDAPELDEIHLLTNLDTEARNALLGDILHQENFPNEIVDPQLSDDKPS